MYKGTHWVVVDSYLDVVSQHLCDRRRIFVTSVLISQESHATEFSTFLEDWLQHLYVDGELCHIVFETGLAMNFGLLVDCSCQGKSLGRL